MNKQPNQALFFLILTLVITAMACTSPFLPGMFGNQSPPTPTIASEPGPIIIPVSPTAVVVIEEIIATTTPSLPEPTQTPEPTPTAVVYQYQLQEGSPAYIENIHHSDLGANWMGVGGQVFDSEGNPVERIVVVAAGTLGGEPIEVLGMTGAASQYGPGGYEIQLAQRLIQSSGSVTVTLYDLAGNMLSAPAAIDTFDDPARATIVLNFVVTATD
jgi:hypothetical protein